MLPVATLYTRISFSRIQITDIRLFEQRFITLIQDVSGLVMCGRKYKCNLIVQHDGSLLGDVFGHTRRVASPFATPRTHARSVREVRSIHEIRQCLAVFDDTAIWCTEWRDHVHHRSQTNRRSMNDGRRTGLAVQGIPIVY